MRMCNVACRQTVMYTMAGMAQLFLKTRPVWPDTCNNGLVQPQNLKYPDRPSGGAVLYKCMYLKLFILQIMREFGEK